MEEAHKILNRIGIATGDEIECKARVFKKMAIDIVTTLGERRDKRHGNFWVYEDKDITIEYDDWGCNLYVVDKYGQVVLVTQTGDITKALLWDGWINKLKELYQLVKLVKAKKELKERYNEDYVKKILMYVDLRS